MFNKSLASLAILGALLTSFAFAAPVSIAQTHTNSYAIKQYTSEIRLEKDTTLTVKETITINFPNPRHGIYRTIPVTHTINGKTIYTKLKVLSVKDDAGNVQNYTLTKQGKNMEIRIGDPDKTVIGTNTYVIIYSIERVLQRYKNHDEVYWNITGSEWDTEILNTKASFSSPFAGITDAKCYSGKVALQDDNCTANFTDQSAEFASTIPISYGGDFTIVVALDKDNDLVFPSQASALLATLYYNWGYILAFLPLLYFSISWLKKGRDKKYLGDNIYYTPENNKEITKPLFAREHLPMVYHPIDNLSPSQVGTIVDEKVDSRDIVAEIIELARLGYMKIEKVQVKKLLKSTNDYIFHRTEKDIEGLMDYQVLLLKKIFDNHLSSDVNRKINEYFSDSEKIKESMNKSLDDKIMILSSLKNNFYLHLPSFKKTLYTNLHDMGYFDGNPDQIRTKWFTKGVIFYLFSILLLSKFNDATGNAIPIIILITTSPISALLANNMPRKTAKGYSFMRQIKGLQFYLRKGKWRHEISEKNLFLEEVMPLAISLGVISEIAKTAKELHLKPPSYLSGFSSVSWGGDISKFGKTTSSTLLSSPGGKSGGSGFSGGSSGGGFGGGGGGSW
jgi:hypothetical protein